jgi:KUP system potassium uptake protein
MEGHIDLKKATPAGLLIALGIIYGDIGTSPLYVFNAIITSVAENAKMVNGVKVIPAISEDLILGTLSCIIWTLTLLTTIKYVWQVLKADNKGEGGIFALYALVRRRKKWLVIPAMIGGATLLADGIITPPISISSAIEGMRELPMFKSTLTESGIVSIVITILVLFFIMQQFGTSKIGKLFGPIMVIWFGMLAVLGLSHIGDFPMIFKALNPWYAVKFMMSDPNNYKLLGAVFLCSTGAEALYSDLGHCGRPNIRVTWGVVKVCLLLNYFGQGAYILKNFSGMQISSEMKATMGINPFFDLMPSWFVIPGVIIATLAAIIASQALISGSFTLIAEASRLNLWPKMKINFPTEAKGQIYIPGINWLLLAGCIGIVLKFKSSSNMEAAYGLAIITTLIMTTILFANRLVQLRTPKVWVYLFLFGYLWIEFTFLAANIEKLPHGGIVTVIVAGAVFFVMYTWWKSRKIKNRYVEFVQLKQYMPMLQDLSNDTSIPKYATHLVYLTSANNPREVEHKVMYSILNKKPKRADIYWFIHVDVVDEPYKMEYVVDTIIPNEIIRIELRLGFRVEQRINLMFRKVVEDMVANKEVNITSRYESLSRNKVAGDFQFMVMEKFLSHENDLPFTERIVMNFYFLLKKISLSEERGFGLDPSYVTVEKYPLVVSPVQDFQMKRIEK